MAVITVTHRPGIDIEEDIREFIRTYDPLKQAVHYLSFEADDKGHVILKGNVRSMQARRVLVDNVPDIPGVMSVDDSQLKDDETLRLEIGKLLPRGMMAQSKFGYVQLHGTPPEGADIAAIIHDVENVVGVRHVKTQF